MACFLLAGGGSTTAAIVDDHCAGIEILLMPAELDLTTSEGVVEQGYSQRLSAVAALAEPQRALSVALLGASRRLTHRSAKTAISHGHPACDYRGHRASCCS